MALTQRLALLALALCACAPPPLATVHNRSFSGSDGRDHSLIDPAAKLQVVLLFSAHCKCQTAHDARIGAMAREFEKRGVRFIAVDSEDGARAESDRAEAEKRGYPFPILQDPHGTLARLFGAEYATYTVLLDHEGHILYRGGIDSDMHDLTASPSYYLKDAILDALDEKMVRVPSAPTLGCALNLE